MNFEKLFQLLSYTAVFCGFFALWASGAIGLIGSVVFLAILAVSWYIEGKKWQLTEKIGTSLVVLSLPVFYLLYRGNLLSLSSAEGAWAMVLAQSILALSAIKLLQRKSERDWIFLYLMAFFEVLLAAGLSISILYLVSFLLYLVVMVGTIIAFEIRKTSRGVAKKQAVAGLTTATEQVRQPVIRANRLTTASIGLIALIIIFGTPLFFFLPRVGGAGLGSNQGKLPTSGFSETIKLGDIRSVQQSDAIAMRVRLDEALDAGELYWRGAAFDTFDNRTWTTAKVQLRQPFIKIENEFIDLEEAPSRPNVTKQTIYLEPLNSSVLFALPRPIRIQGNFQFINRDIYGSLSFVKNNERISYTVESDRSTPSVERLRSDNRAYVGDTQNYLQLPEKYDRRIFNLAMQVSSAYNNRYDKARAIESYLQNNFGYTLDLKVGGPEPLADFLFNVKEGHCEYFATAMVMMLRTQGIASRIATGFHGGEYNDSADITVVRQRNAHAWVEVFFPRENAWVPFDPTPFGALPQPHTGIVASINKYLEALETYWIQYFVAFDTQEQQSMMHSAQRSMLDYQTKTVAMIEAGRQTLIEWWTELRGDRGIVNSLWAAAYGLGLLMVSIVLFFLGRWIYRKLAKLGLWQRLFAWARWQHQKSAVEFYEKMLAVLEEKGLRREPFMTPMEFAYEVGISEVGKITEKYHRVRFGQKDLSAAESKEIEIWLANITNDA